MANQLQPSEQPQNPSLVRVASTAELTGDGPHAVSARGVDLVIVRTRGRLRAFEGRCPHQGALLGEGELDGDTLICRNHRWKFNAETGHRKGGSECLAACPLVEQGSQIFVDISALDEVRFTGNKAKRTLSDLPGPKRLPLLGNMHQLDLPKLHLILESWAREYGPVYRFDMGAHPAVAISSPELSEQVLRERPETFRRVANVEPVFQEMGVSGVFSAEGEAWRSQRRLAMQALSHRHLRSLYPTLRMVTLRLQERWQRMAECGEEVDIVEDLKRFTVDVTTLVTFGHDVNTIEQGDDVIQRKLELVFPAFSRRLFALIPRWRLIRLPEDRRLDAALRDLRTWLGELVTNARSQLAADPARAEKPGNFLEAMLSARDDDAQPFSDDVIFGNLMTMLLAGEDTTAYTLGWAVHQLCENPSAVAELRKETDALLDASVVPNDIETANKLSWAQAIANETMRLRPVAPIMMLETITETVLGDVFLPTGVRIAVLTRPAVMQDAHFENAKQFNPRRWLDGGAQTHDPSAHIPFGSGPRICPGRTLALLEMKVFLGMLYKSFDVERVGSESSVHEAFAFTMYPVGLKVRLRRR